MKVIKNCWDAISASECSYGAHLYENSTAKIYVVNGLDVGPELAPLFCQSNKDGFVGHCLLVFHGVKTFEFVVTPYENEKKGIVWRDPVIFHYEGSAMDGIGKFSLGGGLFGFLAYVGIEIEAQEFELHILKND